VDDGAQNFGGRINRRLPFFFDYGHDFLSQVCWADLVLTAANVAKSTNAQTQSGTAGETVTAGQPVYLSSTDSKLYKSDANDSQKYSAVGIALHASLASQPLTYQTGGDITIGATTAVGSIYMVSPTAGGIMPSADNASGNYSCVLGIAISTTVIRLNIFTGDVAVP
jgi:hypothetical protein